MSTPQPPGYIIIFSDSTIAPGHPITIKFLATTPDAADHYPKKHLVPPHTYIVPDRANATIFPNIAAAEAVLIPLQRQHPSSLKPHTIIPSNAPLVTHTPKAFYNCAQCDCAYPAEILNWSFEHGKWHCNDCFPNENTDTDDFPEHTLADHLANNPIT